MSVTLPEANPPELMTPARWKVPLSSVKFMVIEFGPAMCASMAPGKSLLLLQVAPPLHLCGPEERQLITGANADADDVVGEHPVGAIFRLSRRGQGDETCADSRHGNRRRR